MEELENENNEKSLGDKAPGVFELEQLDVKIQKLKMINFGPDFEAQPADKKIRYLKKLASSMNQAADMLQTERNDLLVLVDALKKQIEYAEQNALQHKNTMNNALTAFNLENQELMKEVQKAQKTVKEKERAIDILNKRVEELEDKLKRCPN